MIETLQQQFTQQNRAMEPDGLTAFRKTAMDQFSQTGFPDRNEELWRFTDLSRFNTFCFDNSGDQQSVEPPAIASLDAIKLIFINGRFAPEASFSDKLPAGVELLPISQANDQLNSHIGKLAHTQSPFVAANSALFQDGAFLRIADGLALQQPIHIIYVVDRAAANIQTRNLVICGENSHVTLIEQYVGAEELTYWTNAVTELFAAESATIDHYKLQQESAAAFHFHTIESELETNATVSNHTINLGSTLARSDIRGKMIGREAEAICNGLYLLKEKQECDTHLFMDHAVPNCNSHQLYKGILNDKAHAVFCGRILVAKDAQQTDAVQSNANLLLSRGSKVNSLPQLEIYADDVKCTHGSTIGELDEQALYYLQTRGIHPEKGHAMLTGAFANEVLESMSCPAVKDYIATQIQAWLEEAAV